MSLRMKIGSNEKIISAEDRIRLPCLVSGQMYYDFSLTDDQSQMSRYYRVSSDTPKVKQQPFCEVTFQNIEGIHSVIVKADGNVQNSILDIVKYFLDLEKSAETDPHYYWTILGLAESTNNDDDIKAAMESLGRSYHEYPEIVGILSGAVRKIQEIRDSMGFLTASMDTTTLTLFVDGLQRGKLNTPFSLPKGEHQLEVRDGTAVLSSTTVVVQAKEHQTFVLPFHQISSASPQKRKKSGNDNETEISGQKTALPAYASGTMIVFLLAVVLIPVLIVQQSFTQFLEFGILGLLSIYLIIRQKKWGLALVGGIYLLLLFSGSYVSLISLVVLIVLFMYYRKEGTKWEWT